MRKQKNINIEIGRNIQSARERVGYTQETLSELIGISPNHMSAIERGASGVSLETLRRICRVLDVSADSIVFGLGDNCDANDGITLRISNVSGECREQVVKIISALAELTSMTDKTK